MSDASHIEKRYREALNLAQAAARRLNVHQLKSHLNDAVKCARVAGIAVDVPTVRAMIEETENALEDLKVRALLADEDSAEAVHYGNLIGRLAYLSNNLGL